MLHTTRAIVLRTIRHADRSTILQVYTEAFGLRSCFVRISRRRGLQGSLFQPLNRLELVMEERTGREVNDLREARIEAPLSGQGDPMRSAIWLFLQEILLRVLKEESADRGLFTHLHGAIGAIDRARDLTHIPIVFLIQLSRPLGFFPSGPGGGEENFDLLEGHFIQGEAPSGHTLRPPLSRLLASALGAGLDDPPPPAMKPVDRRELFDHLLLYYRMHVEGFGDLRSPGVLRQVLG